MKFNAPLLLSPGKFAWGPAETRPLEKKEVLIHSRLAAICGSDIHLFQGEFGTRIHYPHIGGHEFFGIIEETGPEVKRFRPGDRVTVDPIVPCGHCPACQHGHFPACQTLKLLGIDLPGGFGEYVVAAESQCFSLPPSLDDSHACLTEVYSIGLHIVNRAQVRPLDGLAILGCGKIGLVALEAATLAGASPIFITDICPERLAVAQKINPAVIPIDVRQKDPVALIKERTAGKGVERVIECIGHFHALPGRLTPFEQAAEILAPAGRFVMAGLSAEPVSFMAKKFIWKEAEIIASRVTHGEFPKAIAALASGKFHPGLLISETLPSRQIEAAYQKVMNDQAGTLKVLLRCS